MGDELTPKKRATVHILVDGLEPSGCPVYMLKPAIFKELPESVAVAYPWPDYPHTDALRKLAVDTEMSLRGEGENIQGFKVVRNAHHRTLAFVITTTGKRYGAYLEDE